MKCKQKDIQLLYGKLMAPLTIGKPATVLHSKGLVRTSPVRTITRASKMNVVFETENSAYCVVPYFPPAVWKQPAETAA